MNYLFSLDTNLFFLINHLPHNFLLDNFFGLLSFISEYGAIWFVLTFLFFLKNLVSQGASQGVTLRSCEARKLAMIWLTGLISLALAFFLKEIFGRIRPEFILPNVILPFGPDASFSFPSGHALTSFVMAKLLVKLGKFDKLGKGLIYGLAVFISFSRIYLGYHYPLDVVAGAVIGIIVAKITIKILIPRQAS